MVKFSPPAVVSCDLRLNTPRFTAIPAIMKAKKKPLESLKPEDLGVSVEPMFETVKVEPPPVRKGGVIVADVDELVEKLRNEAKVI